MSGEPRFKPSETESRISVFLEGAWREKVEEGARSELLAGSESRKDYV